MLLAHIDNRNTYSHFLYSSTWQLALSWIKEAIEQKFPVREERYEIQGDDMYALIQEKETQPYQDRQFEAHKQYVDLQYCISGNEAICWAPTDYLQESQPYQETEDYALYADPNPGTNFVALSMRSGMFAIFFPGDAHKPLIRNLAEQKIRKIVVKINIKLLS